MIFIENLLNNLLLKLKRIGKKIKFTFKTLFL